MNHFLALRPDHDTRERLAAVAERLRAWDLPARWVHPDDYHLTVAFLGHIDLQEANGVTWAVSDVAASLPGPELALPGLGAVGGRTEPRAVFAAVVDAAGHCEDLHLDLHDALGERPDRRFLPHITLCRPSSQRARSGRSWRDLLEAHGQASWGGCRMAELALMVADGHGLRRYRELECWPLPSLARDEDCDAA